MNKLDMTPTTLEVPKYLKADLRALAENSTLPGHSRKTMKTYLIELIAAEKTKANI